MMLLTLLKEGPTFFFAFEKCSCCFELKAEINQLTKSYFYKIMVVEDAMLLDDEWLPLNMVSIKNAPGRPTTFI